MPNSSPLFLAETITNWYGPDAHGDAANHPQSVFLVLPFSRKTRASPREEGGGLRASDAGPAGPRRPPRNGHRDETDRLRLRAQSAARDRIRAALRAANLSSERAERTLDEAHRARVSLGDALNALPDDAAAGAGDVRGGDLDEDEGGGGSTEAGRAEGRGGRAARGGGAGAHGRRGAAAARGRRGGARVGGGAEGRGGRRRRRRRGRGRDERRARAGIGMSRLVRFGKRERKIMCRTCFRRIPGQKKNPGDAPPSPGFSFCPGMRRNPIAILQY